ncbi:MAG: HDIG domain-containing protein [Anaerolineales bacterium]|nr:HDIG domain-containing protein [Anaerolineales bacterium]
MQIADIAHQSQIQNLKSQIANQVRALNTGRRALSGLLAFGAIALAAAIISLPLNAWGAITVRVGEPAAQEILAPRTVSYRSEILTEEARRAAAAAVPDIYDPPDSRIARNQVLALRNALNFISSVRADTLATPLERRADLLAIRDLALDADVADLLLRFTPEQWTAVQAEALSLLEQIMLNPVRAQQVEDLRRSLPVRISVDRTEEEARAIIALVSPLITANSVYNAAATEAARQAARESVEPVVKQLIRGQIIVARGRVVTPEDLEALRAVGLLQPEFDWQQTTSAVLAVVITSLLFVVYVQRFYPEVGRNAKLVLLLGLFFNGFLLLAQWMVPNNVLLPFAYPASALAMLVTVLAGPHLAMTVAVALGALVGYIGGSSLELAIYTALMGVVAAIVLNRAERVDLFFWSGLASAIAGVGILLVFRLDNPATDLVGLVQLIAASLINGGISAALTLMAFFALGGMFDITTSLQLVELSRPDHPLLRLILRNAPGTYQHSLQIANLAEQAAERIGANAMLVRVGALYHDAGKALHPQYFIENQLDYNNNIHETLSPEDSARVIIRHVPDGLELARRYRLPSRIRDFIAEHHGTLLATYQYKRAVEAAGGDASRVDESRFRYPGPRPRSRETALLMLADGCEAKARSDRPRTEEDIDRIVKSLIDDRLAKGQLDETDLTLNDLTLIRESFVNTLRGVFHPRLQYPELQPPPAEAELKARDKRLMTDD